MSFLALLESGAPFVRYQQEDVSTHPMSPSYVLWFQYLYLWDKKNKTKPKITHRVLGVSIVFCYDDLVLSKISSGATPA